MSERDDGGPAFPAGTHTLYAGAPAEETVTYVGMSLRDWFAGQALAGLYANPGRIGDSPNVVAGYAYAVADAMLEARDT